MPELVPTTDRVCALVGDDDLAHRILSQWASRQPNGRWQSRAGARILRNLGAALRARNVLGR
jgi:hypothetical protein